MTEKRVPFAEIRDTLMTGDIMLFHGLGWESEVIRIVEQNPWSHVAMVVREAEIEYPLIWESFPFKFVDDVILHKRKSGARLVSLDERLTVGVRKKLFDRVAVRHLNVERTSEMMAALNAFISGSFHTLPYPGDWKMLFEFVRGKFFNAERARANEVQCAQLVAETYKCMGLLSPEWPSKSFLPKDFSSEGRLSLLKGAELGEECIIDI